MPYHSDIDFALTLANTADAITVDRFEATDLNVSSKPDMTPVSDADVACEQELRRLITQQYPQRHNCGGRIWWRRGICW